MKRIALEDMTIDQLVERFVALALEQDEADEKDDIPRFNRLFREMERGKLELKTRTGDQRRALLALYDHPNMQVRLKAAKATLAVAPQPARRLLEAIAASGWPPQSGDAGMTIFALDSGIFVPS